MTGSIPANLDDLLLELWENPELSRFTAVARQLWRGDPPPMAVLQQAAFLLAPRLYRREYPQFVPHALMALVGCAQAVPYVEGDDQRLLVTQALWYAAHEEQMPAYPWCPGNRPGDLRGAQLACRSACEDDDFHAFEDGCGPLFADVGPPIRADWAPLLEFAARDFFNLGHKFIYLVKTLQLSERGSRRRDHSPLFFPACHYLATAPRDLSAAKAKDGCIGLHRAVDAPPSVFPRLPVVGEMARVLLDGDSGHTIGQVWHWLRAGVPPAAIVEVMQVVAARLLLLSRPEVWLVPVHAFNYTECVLWALPCMSFSRQITLVVMNALYLQRAVRDAGPVDPELFCRRWKTRTLPTDSPLDTAGFLRAIEAGNWPLAKRLAGHAAASRLSWPEHFQQCVRSVARNDGPLHFGHDVKYAAATLSVFQNMRHAQRSTLILALAKFLARCARRQTLFEAWSSV